jgi:hypothetical protein
MAGSIGDPMPQLACQDSITRGAAQTDAPRFTCYLDDYPDHLVPKLSLDSASRVAEHLIVNPGLLLARLEDLPVGMLPTGLLDNFDPAEEIAWVPRSGSEIPDAFSMSHRLADSVARLIVGETIPQLLPFATRVALQLANMLVEEKAPTAYLEEQQQRLASAATLFQERGYAPVAGLIHPLHLAALRRHYRKLIRLGKLKRGDSQSDRYVAHNEKVARMFHHHLTPAISAIVGEAVRPSYVYSASYQSGASLQKHTDREQCEFSLTFCLDYSPEPCLHTPWPLQLHTGSSLVTVYQGLGDGLVYRGRVIPHSREMLPRGHTSTSIFFHYVPADFQGSLD